MAYIVGGFVRDYLLGIESNDIDITTNATPKELQEIFKDNIIDLQIMVHYINDKKYKI